MGTGPLFLCAIDFSDTCRGALGLAADLARALEANLLLVHAREPAPLPEVLKPSREGVEQELAPVRAELDAWRADAEVRLGRPAEALIVQGGAAEEIARLAAARSCDLVVTGTQGRTGLGRLVVGSVAARILREAPCSVVVVPRSAGAVGAPRRICCAVDLSEPSRVALRQAAELARALGAPLELVHAPPRLPSAPEMLAFGSQGPGKEEAERLRADLAAWEEEARAVSGTEVTSVVSPGDAAVEVLRRAAEDGADLVVVGTHGRTGVRRLVLGSVAERVVREARLPVLVARERIPQRAQATEPDPDLPAGRLDRARIPPFSTPFP